MFLLRVHYLFSLSRVFWGDSQEQIVLMLLIRTLFVQWRCFFHYLRLCVSYLLIQKYLVFGKITLNFVAFILVFDLLLKKIILKGFLFKSEGFLRLYFVQFLKIWRERRQSWPIFWGLFKFYMVPCTKERVLFLCWMLLLQGV